jgi:hypothetical protein
LKGQSNEIGRKSRSFFSAMSILFATVAEGQAESQQRCRNYANRAVQQFSIAQRIRRCNLVADGRRHANYQKHYNWCRTAPLAWLNSEQGARDRHLYRCGGQSNF